MRGDAEEPVPYERYEIRVSVANPSVAEAESMYGQGGPGISGYDLGMSAMASGPEYSLQANESSAWGMFIRGEQVRKFLH